MDAANARRDTQWNTLASTYETNRLKDPVYMSCVRLTAKTGSGPGLILDAGCGTGMVSSEIAHRSASSFVIGADTSFDSLSIMRWKSIGNMAEVSANIESLPFGNDTFDTVVCSNTLQHFNQEQQKCIINELLRVLKPGRRIVISVHHYSRSKIKHGWIKEGEPGQHGVSYIFRFGYSDIERLLPKCTIYSAGFYALLKIPYFGAIMQDIIALMLGKLLARLGVGHMLIAVGVK